MGDTCDCHKPNPGLLKQASREHNLDLSQCVVIGDVGTDILAGHAAGTINILVKTGWGLASLNEYKYVWSDVEAHYVAEHVLDAIQWLIREGYL